MSRVVVSVEELLAGVGATWSASTVAVFGRSAVREGSTVTTRVRDTLAPLARFPIAHVSVPAASDTRTEEETKVLPAGIGSEMLTPVASDGPSFVMPIV